MGRLGHTLSTLRPVGRPTGRKTRFRLLARLYRVGSVAHWVPPKGFFDASYIAFPLSQAFPGASARRFHRRFFDLLARAGVAKALRTDTPTLVALADVSSSDSQNCV